MNSCLVNPIIEFVWALMIVVHGFVGGGLRVDSYQWASDGHIEFLLGEASILWNFLHEEFCTWASSSDSSLTTWSTAWTSGLFCWCFFWIRYGVPERCYCWSWLQIFSVLAQVSFKSNISYTNSEFRNLKRFDMPQMLIFWLLLLDRPENLLLLKIYL